MSDREAGLVTFEIVRNQSESIAKEMGQVLITSSYSPNIKERHGCSTALSDADGHLVAQAEHIPVHLGTMLEAVDTVLGYGPEPGDVFVLNDPFEGGTHLLDVTVVSPLSIDSEVLGYAVSRAHHVGVGGMTPGSMPAGTRETYQEGLRLPPVRLVVGDEINDDVLSLPPANVRNPGERRADIRAQLATNRRAKERLADLVGEYGRPHVLTALDAVIDYSRNRVTAELCDLSDGEYRARNVFEGDGVTGDGIPVEVTTVVDGDTVAFGFDDTTDQVVSNASAPFVIAKSAVYFVVRCVIDPEIPLNQGCYNPISVEVPDGPLLNPDAPAVVVSGNVGTSQRVTDVAFTALADAAPKRVPAQGQGTMNNLIVGSRVDDSDGLIYCETIGDGFGSRAGGDGVSGVQIEMINTLNTPVETLEAEYPLFIGMYGLRERSGDRGGFRGGLGIVRPIMVEADTTVPLLTERRRVTPRNIASGKDRATGQNLVDGKAVPSKTTRDVPVGMTVMVRTPGDGGYSDPNDRNADARRRDREDGKAE